MGQERNGAGHGAGSNRGRSGTHNLHKIRWDRVFDDHFHKSRLDTASIRICRDHAGELFPRDNFIVTNLTLPSRSVVRFYNKRGTAEQWIKEGKQATHWTRLSCSLFRFGAGN